MCKKCPPLASFPRNEKELPSEEAVASELDPLDIFGPEQFFGQNNLGAADNPPKVMILSETTSVIPDIISYIHPQNLEPPPPQQLIFIPPDDQSPSKIKLPFVSDIFLDNFNGEYPTPEEQKIWDEECKKVVEEADERLRESEEEKKLSEEIDKKIEANKEDLNYQNKTLEKHEDGRKEIPPLKECTECDYTGFTNDNICPDCKKEALKIY